MADKSPPTHSRHPAVAVRHSLSGTWDQAELGEALDVSTLSVIGDLDPTGVNGVVREVLAMFLDSLEPALTSLERCASDPNCSKRLQFGAHQLRSAAGQIGALRLAAACVAVDSYLNSHPGRTPLVDVDLRHLVEREMAEIIRVQRRLRALLV
jgi:HPt (histidine-containing phosphotransfer) domain-containing protein